MSVPQTGQERTNELETDDEWPGEKGFRREIDLSKGLEDFEDGETVPKPGYHGTVTWVFPPRWAPDNGEDGD